MPLVCQYNVKNVAKLRRNLRKGRQYPGPAANTFVETADIVLFIRGMDTVVILGKTDQHAFNAYNILEMARDGDGTAATDKDAFIGPFL